MAEFDFNKVHKERIEHLEKIGIKFEINDLKDVKLLTQNKFVKGICTTRNYDLPPFNVSYEEITAIGWNNQNREVSANVCVKLPYGFGGQAPNGSYAYVSFFVNWTPDSPQDPDFKDWFEYVGTASLMLYDNPLRNNQFHSSFHVLHKVTPPAFCTAKLNPTNGTFVPTPPTIVWIRGLLSWGTPVINPWQIPTWGNWFDAKIELAPVF